MGRPKYSEQTLLQQIQEATRKLGRPPTVRDLKSLGMADASTFRARFRKWDYAVKEALKNPITKIEINLSEDAETVLEITEQQLSESLSAKREAYRLAAATLTGTQKLLLQNYGALEHQHGRITGTRDGFKQVKKRTTDLTEELEAIKKSTSEQLKQHSKKIKEAATIRQELLAALRERDQARERAERLEGLLAQSQQVRSDENLSKQLNNAQNRERWVLLSHFRARLRERFDLNLSYPEVSKLDRDLKEAPIVGHTHKGTPMRFVNLDGHEVFCVVTPDITGTLTLTTAYTRGMWEQSKWF